MKNLYRDKKGIFYTIVVVVIVLFIADIMYLTVAVTANSFFDAWDASVTSNTNTTLLQGALRNVGPIVIITVNVGLVVYMLAAAWKRRTDESPEDLLI